MGNKTQKICICIEVWDVAPTCNSCASKCSKPNNRVETLVNIETQLDICQVARYCNLTNLREKNATWETWFPFSQLEKLDRTLSWREQPLVVTLSSFHSVINCKANLAGDLAAAFVPRVGCLDESFPTPQVSQVVLATSSSFSSCTCPLYQVSQVVLAHFLKFLKLYQVSQVAECATWQTWGSLKFVKFVKFLKLVSQPCARTLHAFDDVF